MLNEDDYAKRYIDPAEFLKARTWDARWNLLNQLAINLSVSFDARLRDDLISNATLHAVQQWPKWKPEKGDGFRYFTSVVSNNMRRTTRKQITFEALNSPLPEESPD